MSKVAGQRRLCKGIWLCARENRIWGMGSGFRLSAGAITVIMKAGGQWNANEITTAIVKTDYRTNC